MCDELIALIDADGLASLVGRFARFMRALEDIAKMRDQLLRAQQGSEDDVSFPSRMAAYRQITAVLEFVEDSEELMPDLRQLLFAHLDWENGREVTWLRAPPKKGQPPPPVSDAFFHGRVAAIMDRLMRDGMSKREAAQYCVRHGGLRRRIEANPRARKAANAWETVANWRDRATGPPDPSRAAEQAGFAAMREIIQQRELAGADVSVQEGAKKLLRALKIYFSCG
jgi:hypothetical protein